MGVDYAQGYGVQMPRPLVVRPRREVFTLAIDG
jgi:hypothetical protein